MPLDAHQKELLKDLGLKVKAIRKNKNLTIKELAHSIGKDTQSVHRLEKGGINPSYIYLLEICKGLEIEITELLK